MISFKFGDIKIITQNYSKVTYVRWVFDENLSRGAVALRK